MKAERYRDLEDPELVGRCLAGDGLAWEALIMRYRRLIYSIPNRFGFSPSDCSDVFQTVCVKLIEHLGDLKDGTKVSAWLITTTTRHCIRLKSSNHRRVLDGEQCDEAPDPAESTEEVRIRSERQQKVRDAIEGMAERCRRLLEMLYFDVASPSYAEIAEKLNMPVPSVGPTRARCLDKLRMLLKRRGLA